MKTFYPFFFLLIFISLHIFFTPFTLVGAGDDSACTNSPNHSTSPGLGGTCQWDLQDAETCKVGTTPGTVVRNKCFSDPSQDYRCCVPSPEKDCVDVGGECVRLSGGQDCTLSNDREGRVIEFGCPEGRNCCMPKDPVRRDVGCANAGGTCRWTSSLNDCAGGCYVFGLCRAEAQTFRDGKYYVCCVTNEEFCDGDTDYTKWGDVYLNGDCPFSKPSKSEDRLSCSQGVETTPSHIGDIQPSVDIKLTRNGAPGSEYFIAPDDGEIIYAKAYYTNQRQNKATGEWVDIYIKSTAKDKDGKAIPGAGGKQRCGCVLKLKTTKGIVYEIRHCLLFDGIAKDFDSEGKPQKGSRIKVLKGEILGRIATEHDTKVINHIEDKNNLEGEGLEPGEATSCSSGPHFHVKVTLGEDAVVTDGSGGLDRCIDCHFVDNLGCNLVRSDDPEKCGRCWRKEETPVCYSERWGARCKSQPSSCDPSEQYCCETDRVQVCDEYDCWWVCKCPHPSPGGVPIRPL